MPISRLPVRSGGRTKSRHAPAAAVCGAAAPSVLAPSAGPFAGAAAGGGVAGVRSSHLSRSIRCTDRATSTLSPVSKPRSTAPVARVSPISSATSLKARVLPAPFTVASIENGWASQAGAAAAWPEATPAAQSASRRKSSPVARNRPANRTPPSPSATAPWVNLASAPGSVTTKNSGASPPAASRPSLPSKPSARPR